MRLETKRLILRPWEENDAENLYEYARDPDIGPVAGWPPHRSVEESREIIRTVLSDRNTFAICEKETGEAIGSIGLKTGEATDLTDREDECELGFWVGKPFWGRGYIPEAAQELLRYAFEKLAMSTVWCGYYDGNEKSRRAQEKIGFTHHHTCNEVPVPLLNEIRVGHTNVMTKAQWLKTKM